MNNLVSFRASLFLFATATLALGFAAPSHGAQAPSPSPSPRGDAPDSLGLTLPPWLTEASVTFKQGYDTNVFGTEGSRLPGTPDIANIDSWFTTISTKGTVNVLSLVGAAKGGFFTTFNLGYAGDYTSFRVDSRESNLRNNFTQSLKGKADAWSLSIDNSIVYVVGSEVDPIYSSYSPWGYSATRERRRQSQVRNTSFLRYDGKTWFARGVASALAYDLKIDQNNPVGAYKGYVNWIGRKDLFTGTDYGYKLKPDLAITLGWRLGQQTQAKVYSSPVHNDSTYNRALLGIEGKLLSWLQVQLVAGPEYRRYSDASHLGLAGNRHTWLYTESSFTATAASKDTLTFTNKVWHWVSSGGGTSYQETSNSLSAKHSFSKAFAASIGVKLQGARYDAPNVRNDWLTTYPLNVTYLLSKALTVSVDYSVARGRSRIPVTVAPGRDWNENQASVSLKFTL